MNSSAEPSDIMKKYTYLFPYFAYEKTCVYVCIGMD